MDFLYPAGDVQALMPRGYFDFQSSRAKLASRVPVMCNQVCILLMDSPSIFSHQNSKGCGSSDVENNREDSYKQHHIGTFWPYDRKPSFCHVQVTLPSR